MANMYGIDLGTGNIKIYDKQRDEILNERNMIAIGRDNEVQAIGDEAYEMYEKAPDHIQVSAPLKFGVIADINNMQKILTGFIRHIRKGNVKGADYYIAVPSDINEVEKRAFYDLVVSTETKAKNVRIVDKSIADAVGVGIDVKKAKGVLIVDIGAETTEVSVLSLGGNVLSRLIDTGGSKFDDAICNIVKKEENLVIGKKTAEQLKMNIAFATEPEDVYMDAYGRNVMSGLPAKAEVSAALVSEALTEHIQSIIDNIKVLLERTPPELSSDIINSGIFVTGGGSAIQNLDVLLERELGLKVNLTEKPSESVARGLGEIMSNAADYQKLSYSMKK